ncbi:hypothetical protein [Streptomyces sp. NPDC046805]|uniref:hypothetical protein n=1 Tax=Streptomyces sp. NPDC046805 TaxID=3155134 RepID=UPI0033E9048A
MRKRRVPWGQVSFYLAWWSVVTIMFWLCGKLLGDPTGIVFSALFGAIAVGAGALRDRRAARRTENS